MEEVRKGETMKINRECLWLQKAYKWIYIYMNDTVLLRLPANLFIYLFLNSKTGKILSSLDKWQRHTEEKPPIFQRMAHCLAGSSGCPRRAECWATRINKCTGP